MLLRVDFLGYTFVPFGIHYYRHQRLDIACSK